MPRPNPPPTPGSSSDIRGKEGVLGAPTFNLPPTAYQETDRLSNSSSTPSANGSDSSYRPVSPPSPNDLTRKRSAPQPGPVISKDDFALPPPPTRSRKIIQMKPKDDPQDSAVPSVVASPQTAGKSSGVSQAASKKKQNGGAGATAAGRKIARKTAHSLIERRRRSKMNEEFGVLKDMIPACKGQEMHKLAILQASIEYLRYLEQCVTNLQSQNNSPRPPPPTRVPRGVQDDDDDDDEEMEDEEQDDATAGTPPTRGLEHTQSTSQISLPSLSQITSTATASPSIFSVGAGRHYSISSASQASYSPYFHSNQTSPAFGPQLTHIHSIPTYSNTFGLGSPALKPMDTSQHTLRHVAEGATELSDKQRQARASGRSEHDLDQEAAAALSMLNHDRRSWRAGSSAGTQVEEGRSSTGMSVKDLLSG
ncbi:hypothetical protein LTR62_002000 [Meristemomyces frigidus]|uniref:BHLH domain-containing protein n=1 Tax=Meristemomyces frigidus TaxID=1508187 RepID=A0AAN7YLF2_9PEZI|nr:hypothetical protein LTR62_002000 [Meristemomyces frigidus]